MAAGEELVVAQPALLDETEPSVQRDRRAVVRVDLRLARVVAPLSEHEASSTIASDAYPRR